MKPREAEDAALRLLAEALDRRDFPLAHRALVALEKLTTGELPDVATLCRPREVGR
ncbi:MAG: hypothetical protein U0235_18240 [Polyangiaceae bacterium]